MSNKSKPVSLTEQILTNAKSPRVTIDKLSETVPDSRLLNKREVFLTHGELAGKLDLAMVEIASLKADRKRLLLELHEQDLRLKANQPG